ncbi:MAG: hypothetical protein IJ468_08780 [Lachnospiraceae bacterium]|nr:hypothetical protein [Lachnospiraceae bacterium]
MMRKIRKAIVCFIGSKPCVDRKLLHYYRCLENVAEELKRKKEKNKKSC